MLGKFRGVHIHVTITPATVHNRICRAQASAAHVASFCSSLSSLFHIFLNIMNINLGLNHLLKSRWFNIWKQDNFNNNVIIYFSSNMLQD